MSSRRLQDMSSGRLQDISSRRLQDMPWRRLEDVFSVTVFHLPRRLQDVLQDVFKTSLQDVLEGVELLCWKRVEDVFKTCLEEVLKTSSRPTNVCWDRSILLENGEIDEDLSKEYKKRLKHLPHDNLSNIVIEKRAKKKSRTNHDERNRKSSNGKFWHDCWWKWH